MISTINISVGGTSNKQNGSQTYIRVLFFGGFAIVLCACLFVTGDLETASMKRRLGWFKTAEDAWKESEYLQLLGPDHKIDVRNRVSFRFVTRDARAHLAPTSLVAPAIVSSAFRGVSRFFGAIGEDKKVFKHLGNDFTGKYAERTERFQFKRHSSGKVLVRIEEEGEHVNIVYGVLTAIGAPDTIGHNAGEMARVKFCLDNWSKKSLFSTKSKVCDRWIYYNKSVRGGNGITTNKHSIKLDPKHTEMNKLELVMQGLFEINATELTEDKELSLKVSDPGLYNAKTGEGTGAIGLWCAAKRQFHQRSYQIKNSDDCINMSESPAFSDYREHFKFTTTARRRLATLDFIKN